MLIRRAWILNIFISNIQFDTFWRKRERKKKNDERGEGERKEVQLNLHIITFLRSMCHLHESEPFLSPYACRHTYVHRIELREHRSSSIVFDICVISYSFDICYTIIVILITIIEKKRGKKELSVGHFFSLALCSFSSIIIMLTSTCKLSFP